MHPHVSKESGRTERIHLAFRRAADVPKTEMLILRRWCDWKRKVSTIRGNLIAICNSSDTKITVPTRLIKINAGSHGTHLAAKVFSRLFMSHV
jgi:hypothetical protein